MLQSHSGLSDDSCDPLCFLLGRDPKGHWVVREQYGRYGGLFVSEIEAKRYAKFESASRGAVFEVVAEPIELK